MIAELIVLGSAAFGVAFMVAWLARADLRAWIEAPKYRFQANVRRYDRSVDVPPGSNRTGR